MSRIIFLFPIFLLGCGNMVRGFVNGAGGPRQTPVVQSSGPTILKVSPGHVMSSSSSTSMRATVSPTKQRLTGTGISAEVSISSQRVQ